LTTVKVVLRSVKIIERLAVQPRRLASTMEPCLSAVTIGDQMQRLAVGRAAAVVASIGGTVSTDSPTFFL
jgi:hypothetical protein